MTISDYQGEERHFLMQLATILGAKYEDSYKRINNPLLICSKPDTVKFNAAIKWGMYIDLSDFFNLYNDCVITKPGLPVVAHEWLLQCYKQKTHVPLQDYLVGGSKVASIAGPSETAIELRTGALTNEGQEIQIELNLEGAANRIHQTVAEESKINTLDGMCVHQYIFNMKIYSFRKLHNPKQ